MSQDYSMGQGSAHGSAPIEDDSPFEEVTAPVKAKKVSKHRQKIVTIENKESAKPWTIAKEVALCQAWCDVSENDIIGNVMKSRGFWLKFIDYFEKETGSQSRGYDAISGSCDLTVYQKACLEYAAEYDHDFLLEPCSQILKDHSAWKQIEMPLFYSKQNPGSKKAKTFETTSGSAQGGLNLNEKADGSGEEVQEARQLGRDRPKKKASSSSSSKSSSVAGGGLVDLVTADIK
ncbi:hypothetical protein Tco_0911762 [Tanacetum coccineum]|uniref:No apical meristem-associated C-terminal domain-containing protein n=1 Tax=Tanacetum coccineum TaxID=301880 RepID=A0ABQ5CZD3_9ASTR